jgi:protein O-GlcNAc transferase
VNRHDSSRRTQRLQRAIQLHQQGELRQAEAGYRAVLREEPDSTDALHLLGVIEGQKGRFDLSLQLIRRSLQLNPLQPLALVNLAKTLLALEKSDEALETAEQVLECGPSLGDDLRQRALVHQGGALLQLQRPEAALRSFDSARRLRPGAADGHCGRGRALLELNRASEALGSFEQAIGLDPGELTAHNGRGVALRSLGRPVEALAALDRALELGKDDAATHTNRAAVLFDLGRMREAAESLEKVAAANPRLSYVLGNLMFARLQGCDWREYRPTLDALAAGIAAGQRVSTPFACIALVDSQETQLACARIYTADRYPQAEWPAPRPRAKPGARISVGYLSADFRDHATSHLIAGLIEGHDRATFEVTALSCGPDDGSAMRARMTRAFDHFIDLWQHGDRDAAELIRRRGIDILVDLNGHAAGGRPGILARRPAPIQVNYLGYPGTMGADYVDYVIADAHVIPPADRRHYAERVGYLPHCYQPNDSTRPIAAGTQSREDAGLPSDGFVFCSFNAAYKIAPAVFELWMRLLGKIEGSVLWLYRTATDMEDALRQEAQRRGIAPGRLVFADRQPQPEHLARHALADLFLDTLPVNAHTTASDALWAGLPVLTCSGNSFAGRVAGSLLKAVGLPELITADLGEYEARALELATTPATLAGLRGRLLSNRRLHRLFDTSRYRRHLESAYLLMWERCQRGEPAEHFEIAP